MNLNKFVYKTHDEVKTNVCNEEKMMEERVSITVSAPFLQTGLLLYFLLHIYDRQNIILGSNFRNGDFEGFIRFEVP